MNIRPSTLAEALVWAQEQFPANVQAQDVYLKNGIAATTLALGDLVMLDQSSTGIGASSQYAQVIAPTTAGNLATAGSYHLVAQESIATGTVGRFRLYGDTVLNLNASSATIGTILYTRGVNKDATNAVTAGGKIIGKTKIATTTGVVRVFFDGRGVAAVPTLVGLNESTIKADEIYVGTTTPLVAGTVEIASASLVTNKTWNAADSGGNLIGWFDWAPPKRWDAGTVTAQVLWSSAAATAGPCVFSLAGGAVSDGDSLALTVGSEVTMTDTASATADLLYQSPISAACTIGGTPAKSDLVKFRIMRTSAAAGDTLAATVRIHAVKILWTADAMTDD